MLENFLTIPDAPKYEINSQLICRNKQTGYILKLMHMQHRWDYYSLQITPGKAVKFSPKTLRRIAVTAVKTDTFEPIPSLGGRYEINLQGKVRNAKSKHILKLKRNGKICCVRLNGKTISLSIADLLWEVHGRMPKKFHKKIPCTAENATQKIFFSNLYDCAKFLTPKIFLSTSWIRGRLCRRDPIIYGWKITYLEDKPKADDFYLGKLGREAQRLKKLDKELGYEN